MFQSSLSYIDPVSPTTYTHTHPGPSTIGVQCAWCSLKNCVFLNSRGWEVQDQGASTAHVKVTGAFLLGLSVWNLSHWVCYTIDVLSSNFFWGGRSILKRWFRNRQWDGLPGKCPFHQSQQDWFPKTHNVEREFTPSGPLSCLCTVEYVLTH